MVKLKATNFSCDSFLTLYIDKLHTLHIYINRCAYLL